MALAPNDTVPLDRRFERATTSDSAEYWAEALADKPRNWKWLRERSRVVALLAQAGSGKTVEFMRQVDQARSANRDAFFFRVERLCSGPLEGAHETPDCRARFEEWVKASRPAEFFLDAVDEAKLPQARTARPLRDALRALSFALGPHFGRISILVSCRSSEWFDDVEQKALDELAAAMSAARTDPEPISVFNATFAPLDATRVRLLAQDRGGDDAIALLTESEAIADIVTPLDAILYLDTYLEFEGTPDLAARFSSRGGLLDTSVRRRLAEQGGETRRSQLDLSTGLRAARFLAFATIVAQTMDIAVGAARKDCVDPQELLAGGHAALSPDGIRQLLACPLFVPAGQARVRFYRREARDLLAAQWLRNRIDEGASALSITDRFIKGAFGEPRVPIVYGSMLAWLASYDPNTLRRMIKAAPHWIIEGGDPRSLALEDRVATLEQHFRLGPGRFHGEFMFEVGELRRFARPELEEAIFGHLADPPAGDLFDHLMQLVEAGRYASAAPKLVLMLCDFSRSSGDRMFAMRALLACGGSDDLQAVAKHFISTGGPTFSGDEAFGRSRNDRLLLDLVTAAYPNAIGVADALTLLSQIHGKDYSHEAKSVARWLATSAPSADLAGWLVGLDRLCFDLPDPTYSPFGHAMPKMHRRATVLLRGLLEITARYLAETSQFDIERDLLIYDRVRHANKLGASFSMSRGGSPVPAALTSNAEFRHALYQRLATDERRKHTAFAYIEHIDWSVYRGGADRVDLRWFLELYGQSDGEKRRDYAHSAVFLADRFAKADRIKARLTIGWVATKDGKRDWSVVRQVTTDPLLAPWRRYRARRSWNRYDPDAGARAFFNRMSAAMRLRLDIWLGWASLRRGTASTLLTSLVLGERYDPPLEADLVKRFGERLGAVLIDGARAYARTYRPVDRGRQILGTDILAQAGFKYAWNADRSMPGVDPTAAMRAALLFATDWPDWATGLALANPGAWKDLVTPLLADEIASATHSEAGSYSRFLSIVSHVDEEIRTPLSAPLFAAIASLRVIDGIDIERIVRILRADPEIEELLPAFAARHAREAWHEGSVRRALNWLPVWAEKDEGALRSLLGWMALDTSIVADGLGIYSRLFDRESKVAPASLDIRYRFADLAYSHVAPSDDPPMKEGPHSVGERDNLQHLRSSIGELLSADFDTAERDALERLLNAHIVPVSSEWADRWRHRYGQQAVKPRPWTHATIIGMGGDLAEAPASGDELLASISAMVADLEQELATAEFDRRGLFPTTILESDFRAWLGHALDSRRRDWFSIVQEAETSSATRTDLRIELRSTGSAIVVIEIKLLHGWKYEELLDKFRSQLVDQYLLTPRVRHGIYLIVDLGKKAKGAMPDGSTPTCEDIALMLNATSVEIAAKTGAIVKAQTFRIAPSKRNRRRDQSQSSSPKQGPIAKLAS